MPPCPAQPARDVAAWPEAIREAPRRHRNIVGRYEILREIGRGGMAIVYVARQPDLDRQVALKELSRFHAGSAEYAHRFLRESRLAGSLNHPNIVTVYEYFEHATIAVHRDGVRAARLAAAVHEAADARPDRAACSRACSPASLTRRRRASSTATSSPRTSWSPATGA